MRLIDVEPVLDSLQKEEQYAHDRVRNAPYNGLMAWGMILQEVGAVIHELESQPTVDAVPVRHGKWFYGESESGHDGYYCSQCGKHIRWRYGEEDIDFIRLYNYCPNCGARMDEE